MLGTPCLVRSWHTQPIRRMLVSRSSRENPSPLLRWVRTTSPSRISTATFPRRWISSRTQWAIVVFPAPESPVNHTVKPLFGVCSTAPPASLVCKFAPNHGESYGVRFTSNHALEIEVRLRLGDRLTG